VRHIKVHFRVTVFSFNIGFVGTQLHPEWKAPAFFIKMLFSICPQLKSRAWRVAGERKDAAAGRERAG
jgi:hypothetical protein